MSLKQSLNPDTIKISIPLYFYAVLLILDTARYISSTEFQKIEIKICEERLNLVWSFVRITDTQT